MNWLIVQAGIHDIGLRFVTEHLNCGMLRNDEKACLFSVAAIHVFVLLVKNITTLYTSFD